MDGKLTREASFMASCHQDLTPYEKSSSTFVQSIARARVLHLCWIAAQLWWPDVIAEHHKSPLCAFHAAALLIWSIAHSSSAAHCRLQHIASLLSAGSTPEGGCRKSSQLDSACLVRMRHRLCIPGDVLSVVTDLSSVNSAVPMSG